VAAIKAELAGDKSIRRIARDLQRASGGDADLGGIGGLIGRSWSRTFADTE